MIRLLALCAESRVLLQRTATKENDDSSQKIAKRWQLYVHLQ